MIPKPFIKSKNVFTVKDEVGPTKIIRSHKKPIDVVDDEYYDKWCGHTQTILNQEVLPQWMMASGVSTTYPISFSGVSSTYHGVSGTFGVSGSWGLQGTAGIGGVSGTSGYMSPASTSITTNPPPNLIQIPPWNIMGETKKYKYIIPLNTKKWWQFWKKTKLTTEQKDLLLKDSMVLINDRKAPNKKIFKINVGKIPPYEN